MQDECQHSFNRSEMLALQMDYSIFETLICRQLAAAYIILTWFFSEMCSYVHGSIHGHMESSEQGLHTATTKGKE